MNNANNQMLFNKKYKQALGVSLKIIVTHRLLFFNMLLTNKVWYVHHRFAFKEVIIMVS